MIKKIVQNNNKSETYLKTIREFFSRYDLKIKNIHWYIKAFTHNSYANENGLNYNYQRLEFLGDAILSKETSLYLFLTYPNQREGYITNIRSKMVREATLANLTREIKLQQFLLLGKGEIKTKGFDKDRILADIYESVIGAIYLDLGDKAVHKFVKQTLLRFVNKGNYLEEIHDYKTALQEFIQAGNQRSLEYKIVNEIFDAKTNITTYEVIAQIDGVTYGWGKGKTHKEAEQLAAKNALDKLEIIADVE